MPSPTPSIYLAGFDVFRPDAQAYGMALKGLCAQYGFDGLFPLDNAAPASLSGRALARWIFEANLALLESADLVMANLNDFRGQEPDSGTCFEIGYAAARQIPVWAYTQDGRPLIEQCATQTRADGIALDANGMIVEDFGLPRNLMLACATTIVVGDAQACLARIAKFTESRVK
jgi:nucleoside 2-deoxyribosyltransferase